VRADEEEKEEEADVLLFLVSAFGEEPKDRRCFFLSLAELFTSLRPRLV
jgi:hypothetical protein